MPRYPLLALAFTVLAALPAWAGEYNKKINLGDAAPVWKDLPGTDDQRHSLADLKDKDVVVVVFTCNSCAVAVAYEDRIISFAKKYAGKDGKVAVVAINVNVIEEDRLPKMKERARTKEFPFLYLFDESQQIARAFGASYTPEFFVLDKDRKVVYMGAMDDKSNAASVTMRYLEAAVEAALKGQKPQQGETSAAAGCGIRFLREKK